MNKFEYADDYISDKQIMIAVASFVIGVGILSMPQRLASVTMASDGWVSLLISGMGALIIAWSIARFCSKFPSQSFLTFATSIVTKPVAIVFTTLFAILSMNITALQVRQIADISKHYLLKETPLEVISLSFFLLIIYAVTCSRVGLFRLNTLFLPFVLVIAIFVIVFNMNEFKFGFLSPTLESNFSGYIEGTKHSLLSFGGFGMLWFYISLVRKPKKTPQMAAFGMLIPIVLYLMLYLACILVFGVSVTSNLQYPTIELAKIVEIPGGVFERFESIFFVIWIMAIFNTTAMALDIAVFALNSIFPNIDKFKIILVVSPLIYVISMYPQDIVQVASFGKIVSYSAILYPLFILFVLFIIAKIRRVT